MNEGKWITLKDGRKILLKPKEIKLNGNNAYMNNKIRHISTFKGQKNFQDAILKGYKIYLGDDLELAGSNFEEVSNKLIKQGYQVRVFQGKKNAYSILYKK